MNISLPVIDNMFAGVVAAGPRRSKPPGMKNTGQLYKASTDGPCLPDTANTEKTDNSAPDAGRKPVNGLFQDPESMLHKKTAAGSRADAATVMARPRTPCQGSAKTKCKSQHPASAAVPGANPAQLASAKKSLTTAGVLGTPIKLTDNLSSNGLKPALPSHSKRLIATDMQQEGVKNADKVPVSNPKAAATEGLAGKKPGPKSMVKVAAANRIAALSDEKPPIANTSPTGMRQKAHVWQDRLAPPQREHPDTDQNASAGPDKSALPGDKSAVAGTVAGMVKEKTQLLDDRFPQVHERAADTEQKMSVGPEKSALSVEKPRDNPAPVSREPKLAWRGTDSQILSESAGGKEQAGNLLRKSFLQELNVAEFRIATGHAKDRGRPTSGNGSSIHFTRALASDNTHIPVSELPSGSAQATKVAHTALPTDVSNTMSEQIMESIRGSLQQGDRCITIRLHPPDLGKLVVRFQEQGDQITGLLEVSKAQTRCEIEQALPQIIQTLRDSGVQINRLEVLLADQSERYANRDELPQNGSFQQDSSTEGGNSDNKSNYERLTDPPNGAYQDNPEPQVQIGDNSINVLI